MTSINIERLGALLDRGQVAASASLSARADLTKAEESLRKHRGDDATRAALQATVDRRRAANASALQRANAWQAYCDSLRDIAKKHGVQL
jgi:hypothetical protein